MPQVTIQPTTTGEDAFILSANATTNFGTNTSLYAGNNTSGVNSTRPLLRIPQADLVAQVPAGAKITAVDLMFYNYQFVNGQALGSWVESFYRVLKPWVESQVTHTIAYTAQNWTVAGCGSTTYDRVATASATATMDPNAAAGWQTISLNATGLADVQAWREGHLTNNGWLRQAATPPELTAGGVTYIRWYSSDYTTDTSLCPKFVITYELPEGVERYYLQDGTPTLTPAALGGWEKTSDAVTKPAGMYKLGSLNVVSSAETSTSATYDVLCLKAVFPPMAGPGRVAIANMCLGLWESDGAADMWPYLHIYVRDASGNISGVLMDDIYVAKAEVSSASGTSGYAITPGRQMVDYDDGDQVVAEIGLRARNASSTSYSGTCAYGGTGATDLVQGAAGDVNPSWIDLLILPNVWSGEQLLPPPQYIYEDRFTLEWTEETDPGFASYVVLVGIPGFDPTTASPVATITDAATTHYNVTGRTAVTEYESYLKVTIDGVAYYSNVRHVDTCRAGEITILADGEVYYGQTSISPLETELGTEICIGANPANQHIGDGSSTYVMDARSLIDPSGNVYMHFSYERRVLADPTPPTTSGYYLKMLDRPGDTPVGWGSRYNDGPGNVLPQMEALDARGRTWGDSVDTGPLNDNASVSMDAMGAGVVHSDGSLGFATIGYDASGNVAILWHRCTDWPLSVSQVSVVYVKDSIAGVKATEACPRIVSGTYPNETIVIEWRPADGSIDPATTSPYMIVSTTSGQTWGASAETDFGDDIGTQHFGNTPPSHICADSRTYMVGGYRSGSDAANGSYLATNPTQGAATGFGTSIRVTTDTSANDVGETGHADIALFGASYILVIATTCVGRPRSEGGSGNPKVVGVFYTRAATPVRQTPTKYTPETEPWPTPAAPSINAASGASVDVSWTDVLGDVGYLIQRKTGAGAFADLDSVAAGVESYEDTTGTPGTTYTYRVSALGLFANSGWSNEASATFTTGISGVFDSGIFSSAVFGRS